MRLKLLNVLLVSTIICGCSLLGPDYKKPNVDTPSNWNSGHSNTTESGILMSDTAWWEQFHDPQLNKMIHEALVNNNNIQIAIGNIAQAKEALAKSQSAWVPVINFGGGAFTGQSFNQNYNTAGALSGTQIPSLTGFDGTYAGFTPVYVFNILQNIKNEDISKLNLKLQQANNNAVRLIVIGQVTGGYFNLLGLHKQLELEKQMIADIEEYRKFVKVQIANGSKTQIDYEDINQMLYSVTANVASIEDNITQTQNALQVLMNKNPESIATNMDFDSVRTDNLIPVNLPSEVLKNRPDIMYSEYQMQISNAKIGLAMSQFFPTIGLTTPLGFSSLDLTNLLSGSDDFWAAQVIANVPILNLGIYQDIKLSKASYYSAYYSYIQTVRSAFADVDNSLSKHASTDKAYLMQQKSLVSASEEYRLSNVQYQDGTRSYSNTIGYKVNVDSSKLNLNKAKMDKLTSIVNLYQSLGGGYNVESTESMNKFGDDHDI